MSRVFEALAAGVRAEGIDTVFCVLGDGNLDLMVRLAEHHGVRLVHARHEQGATAMADGYARRSGQVGCCSVTHGPGITQTGTSLKVAVEHSSRLLMLAGDTPAGDPHHIQSLPQAPFVQALGAHYVPLRTAGRWSADLTEALASARAGRPTVLGAATDLQLAATDEIERHPAPTAPHAPTAAADSGIAEAATILTAAKAPVILAGRGARAAATELQKIAETLGAPVVTTLGAKGLAAGHPHQRGLIGGLGNAEANTLLAESDCVLAVGASLTPWSTQGGRRLDGALLVQIDAARERFGHHVTPDIALWGDAAATLRRLRHQLPDRPRTVRALAPPEPAPVYDEHAAGGIDPRLVFAALEAALPADRTLVLDGGHFITFACSMLSVSAPERFVFSCDFATIGQGLAMAIGASVAAPESRTTLIAGDGGLLMSIAELDTAVRYRLPINVVVINDEAYGQEVHSLAAKGLPTYHAQFAVPDLGALARGWGADGHRIDTPNGLESLGELLGAAGGPRVIDIRVNPEVVSDAAKEIFRQVREAVPA